MAWEKMMTVIAMTREMGTRGKDIAAEISDRLGIEVIHHEVVERHLAERLSMTESAVHRFLEGEASLWERWKVDRERLSRFTRDEILELAMRGNVLIRGWGAAQLLHEIPHVICVRICAPMANRIREMKRRLAIDDDDTVHREILRNDEAHSRVVQRQFHTDWKDPTGYDIVINTAFVAIEAATALLQQLAKSGHYEVTDESRLMLFDKRIEVQIRTILDMMVPNSTIGSDLGVKVRHGHVVIDGVVSAGGDIRRALDKIRNIDDVKSVTDKTFKIPNSYGI